MHHTVPRSPNPSLCGKISSITYVESTPFNLKVTAPVQTSSLYFFTSLGLQAFERSCKKQQSVTVSTDETWLSSAEQTKSTCSREQSTGVNNAVTNQITVGEQEAVNSIEAGDGADLGFQRGRAVEHKVGAKVTGEFP